MDTHAAPQGHHRHSPRHFAHFARRWGYGCEVSSIDGSTSSSNHDLPIAEGVLSVLELPCGVKFCASDLVVSRHNARAGILSRSLTTIVMLQGQATNYRLGSTSYLLEAGSAVTVTAADSARLSGCYRRGDRFISLALQACPLDIPDDELAERLHQRLRSTEIGPLAVNDRVQALANELFDACRSGPVARLLAESCALELLARSLVPEARLHADVTTSPHPRDVVRIRRVRDKLLSDLAEDHRLCDLARLAGMSVSSLKAKFPLMFGQSVFEFLREQRLARAREGLESEGWSVKQAAYFVGYTHPSNFATAYRRRFGIAPSETRSH